MTMPLGNQSDVPTPGIANQRNQMHAVNEKHRHWSINLVSREFVHPIVVIVVRVAKRSRYNTEDVSPGNQYWLYSSSQLNVRAAGIRYKHLFVLS
jgi:hypothetical protein